MKIAPSILSADFVRLGDELGKIEDAGADMIHIDVMDGHFVPNITIGPFIVEAVRKATSLPLDVHLMIDRPDDYVSAFADAGADIITVHVEAATHLHRTIQQIKEKGKKAGVSLNPSSPLIMTECILEYVDLLLIMSVNPGFSGQKFIPSALEKIREARRMLDKIGSKAYLEVDGGIKLDNIAEVASAGADMFVSGSGVFGTQDYKKTIEEMKKRISS
ncbi:MAG: ribulose-phosphate 3-epimerase [Nitrospirae bacterium RBG_16_43_11]|nr:MAG: ribulose-phosphate 3-epimerase [Nitrospirae bacterium RBG_16_43_11]